ncbi:MAG: acetyl/propionyl-CoA carboxylase subunit alpha, partial [Desulfomonile tiedjei]|nr:acetyl/propionyl-CoA carboxylase subunit alpha [Desulfomonile tiedjei]
EENFAEGESNTPPSLEILRYMSMAVILVYHNRRNLVRESLKPMSPSVGVPQTVPTVHDYVIRVDRTVFEARLEEVQPPHRWRMTIDGRIHEVVAPEFEYYRRRLKLAIDGVSHMFRLQYENNHIRAFFCGVVRTFEIYDPREWGLAHYMHRERKVVHENVLKCPMPGLVTEVCVEDGAYVRRGQEMLRMESMKMETGVASPIDGQIDKIMVRSGDAVETDQVLVVFKA